MKEVTLAAEVEGGRPGDKISVEDSHAEWLITKGYAYVEGDDSEKTATGVTPDKDPQNVENRPTAGMPELDDDAEEATAGKVFANMDTDDQGESVTKEAPQQPQRIGNAEANATQAQADLADIGGKPMEDRAQDDAPEDPPSSGKPAKGSAKA